MEMTHRWLKLLWPFDATGAKYGYSQTLFPIVQVVLYKDLRVKSAEVIMARAWKVMPIGGLSVGEPAENDVQTTDIVTDILPKDKRHVYLMGVGVRLPIFLEDWQVSICSTVWYLLVMLVTVCCLRQRIIINIKNENGRMTIADWCWLDSYVVILHTKPYLRAIW